MSTTAKHIHKLKRHIYQTGNRVFFCVDGDCTFKLDVPLALGKRSICWRCGDPFEMNQYSIRLAKPHCPKCHHTSSGNKSYVKSKSVEDLVELASEKSTRDVSPYDRRREERKGEEPNLYLVGEQTEPKELRERLHSITENYKTQDEEFYRTVETDEDDPEL